MQLQAALGKLRRTLGHFKGTLLAIDPHRTQSYSRRQMRQRVEKTGQRPVKMAQTFWVLDADTCQPVCFTTATTSRNVADVTPELVDLAAEILQPSSGTSLILVDAEHFSVELLQDIQKRTGFDMLVPVPNQPGHRRRWKAIPEDQFTRRWAGFATAKADYKVDHRHTGSFVEFVERSGECSDDWHYKGFVCTADRDEVQALTVAYPHRWHIEEFFNANQSLGWQRAGTMNLNIRYAQMTMALIAQAVIHQLRQRLGQPFSAWDADHLSGELFSRLDGDVRVTDDTIIVTYYNAPNADLLQQHYVGLPDQLAARGVSPQVPWLYNYRLDFRFR